MNQGNYVLNCNSPASNPPATGKLVKNRIHPDSTKDLISWNDLVYCDVTILMTKRGGLYVALNGVVLIEKGESSLKENNLNFIAKETGNKLEKMKKPVEKDDDNDNGNDDVDNLDDLDGLDGLDNEESSIEDDSDDDLLAFEEASKKKK